MRQISVYAQSLRILAQMGWISLFSFGTVSCFSDGSGDEQTFDSDLAIIEGDQPAELADGVANTDLVGVDLASQLDSASGPSEAALVPASDLDLGGQLAESPGTPGTSEAAFPMASDSALGPTGVGHSPESPAVEPHSQAMEQDAFTYTVKRGDWLSKIAQRVYGDMRMWNAIYEANRDKITNPDLIFPGQKIVVPQLNRAAQDFAREYHHTGAPHQAVANPMPGTGGEDFTPGTDLGAPNSAPQGIENPISEWDSM